VARARRRLRVLGSWCHSGNSHESSEPGSVYPLARRCISRPAPKMKAVTCVTNVLNSGAYCCGKVGMMCCGASRSFGAARPRNGFLTSGKGYYTAGTWRLGCGVSSKKLLPSTRFQHCKANCLPVSRSSPQHFVAPKARFKAGCMFHRPSLPDHAIGGEVRIAAPS
jgi:hypothetical protein